MRLAGIENGGFYLYPPHMAEATASWFISLPTGTHGRLPKPYAGEGEIANLLGKLLTCKTWNCDLFPYRAEKAAARMDRYNSPYLSICFPLDLYHSATLLLAWYLR